MRTAWSRPALTLGPAIFWCVACASTPQVHLSERIGGSVRARTYASPMAYEAYLRAEVATARGDLDAARRQLDLAELADPDDGYLPARRAEVLLRAGDLDGAESAAMDAVSAHPDASAPWIALAEVRTRRGDAPGALAAVRRAVTLDPDDPDARAAAVAAAGGDASAVARARDHSPLATVSDRAASWGAAVYPSGDPRRETRAWARREALRYTTLGQWTLADRLLAPLVDLDPLDLTDRLRLIDVRVRDGRLSDAARLVPGVPVGTGPGVVSPAVHARLWLDAGRPALARDEADRAVTADATDARATLVLGESLVALGGADRARGLTVLAGIAPGTEHYARARQVAAGVLWEAGLREASDAVLMRAVAGAATALGRDQVRIARAMALAAQGGSPEVRTVLSAVETPWGRHRRGELEGAVEATHAVLDDLAARTGDPYEDALADAVTALVCVNHPGQCPVDMAEAALARARANAPAAALTLRAVAAVGHGMSSNPVATHGDGTGRPPGGTVPAGGMPPRALGVGELPRGVSTTAQ